MPTNREELTARLRLHEDSFVERKLEGHDIMPTIVGFANSVPTGRDAILFIGVRDNGEVVGVKNADSLQKKLQKSCKTDCYPPIACFTELLVVDEKQIVAVVIPPSLNRPHFAGPAYIRKGSTTVAASEEAFADLINARTSKAAELLRYRGQPITVVSIKNRLGQPEHTETRGGTTLHGQMRRYDATILDVNSFFVRFEINQTRYSEPLDNITISYDEEKHKPLVHVHLDHV